MVALGSAGSLAAFAPPPGVVRLLIAAELATATAHLRSAADRLDPPPSRARTGTRQVP